MRVCRIVIHRCKIVQCSNLIYNNNSLIHYTHIEFLPDLLLQTYQSSPGGHSSCSSEPSPLSSANNNDSGVEMAMHSGGSFGDLSAPDECPMVDSTVPAGGLQAGVGLQMRKAVGHVGAVTIKLENIKKERLKSVRDSCPWVNSAPQPLQGQRNSMKLPPIPTVGKCESLRSSTCCHFLRPSLIRWCKTAQCPCRVQQSKQLNLVVSTAEVAGFMK